MAPKRLEVYFEYTGKKVQYCNSMLEYLDYEHSLDPEDKYIASVLRADGSLQRHGNTYFYSPQGNDKNYAGTYHTLLANGTLLYKAEIISLPPLRTFTPLAERRGIGITCRGTIIDCDAVLQSIISDILVLGAYDDFRACITVSGECWMLKKGILFYRVPLPYKPLALCVGLYGKLYVLTPYEHVEEWVCLIDGSYVLAGTVAARNWCVCEHYIANA